MTLQKRLLDIFVAAFLAVVLSPVLLILVVTLIVFQGGPIFYVSERMRGPTEPFWLIKFRTMSVVARDGGVTGGNKSVRMTRLQRFLRKSRLDELPQLWNVLRGDISLVGPRPPLRLYVDAFPELYGRVLKNRPGITGLASLRFHEHEERLLRDCKTAEETDTTYRNRCIPRKAQLDEIYGKNASICFDLVLILETARKPFRQ